MTFLTSDRKVKKGKRKPKHHLSKTTTMHESFNDLLNNPDQNLDEAMIASFCEENEDDTYRRRKKQMNKLYLPGRFNDIKGEFARKVLGSECRIDPTDGQDSMEFISSLDITKHQLTFDGTIVGYVGTDGAFKLSENKKSAGFVTEFKSCTKKDE